MVLEQPTPAPVLSELLGPAASTSNIPVIPTVNMRTIERGDEESLLPVIGKLRHLCDRTRPDLVMATSELGTGGASPGPEHTRAAKRVLRYLKGTVESTLILGGESDIVPLAYCDASYITEDDCRSRYGYCIYECGRGASIVKSKLATTVHHSPCEVEVEVKAIDETVR